VERPVDVHDELAIVLVKASGNRFGHRLVLDTLREIVALGGLLLRITGAIVPAHRLGEPIEIRVPRTAQVRRDP